MAKREETLAKNTLLFALGNFGSKLLQIILVPFYTRFMSEAQYGTVDLMQAIVSLLVPIASLTVAEGVFRYAMEKEYDKTAVLSVGVLVTGIGMTVLCLCGAMASLASSPVYIWLVVANTVTNAVRTLFSQYTRAIGRTALFALDNVLLTGMVLVMNIVFIAALHLGIEGYMLGYILANLFSAMFLIFRLGGQVKLRFRPLPKGMVREMLRFSLPLVPNTICWWIISFLDRTMVTSMVGVEANGLYAAAHKIPSLLSVVMSVFFQAWQISANEEFKKKDIAAFYSKIFHQISACLFVLAALLITLSKPINSVFLGADYYAAWQIMPPLVLSMVFFSYAQFLGSVYTANKKTKMAFVTNVIGVAVSVALNLILIPLLGALGAAVANAVSYLVLWLVRVWDTGKIVSIGYQTKRMIIACAILVGQTVLVCMDVSVPLTYGLCGAGICILTAMYWKTLLSVAKFALQFAKRLLKRR